MKKYKIYVLKDPRDNQIRYVGCTKSRLSRRLYQHRQEFRAKKITIPNLKHLWIQELAALGLVPIIQLVEDMIPEAEVYQKEDYYIHKYKIQGCNLLNILSNQKDNAMFHPEIVSRFKGSGNANYGKKGYANHKSKAIEVYSLDGTLIEEFGSMRQAHVSYSNVDFSSIVRCCKGQLNRAGNFIFKYKESTYENNSNAITS